MKKNCCIFFSLVIFLQTNTALAEKRPMVAPSNYQDYESMPEYNPPTPFPSVTSSPSCPTIRVCKWVEVYYDELTGEVYEQEVCQDKKMC